MNTSSSLSSLPIGVGDHTLPQFSVFHLFQNFNCPRLPQPSSNAVYNFFLCLPLALFTSIFAVVSRWCKLCLLITCPINCACCIHKSCISVSVHQCTLISTFGCPWNLLHSSKKPHPRCLYSFFNSFAQYLCFAPIS